MEDFKLDATEKMAHIEESVKSAHRRIDELKRLTESVYELATSIKTMQINIETTQDAVTNVSNRLKVFEDKPGKRWDLIVTNGITAIVCGLIGYILFKLGLGG